MQPARTKPTYGTTEQNTHVLSPALAQPSNSPDIVYRLQQGTMQLSVDSDTQLELLTAAILMAVKDVNFDCL